jgi:UDP-glucose:(heptosyl)LPS alpha-1,3-glucosyltransferase
MVRDEIRSRFGLPKANLPVIYNSVDTELYHPGLRAERARTLERHGIDAAAIVFLCVARDLMRGGIDTAIDALARIPAPAHLIVIGDDRAIDRVAVGRALGIATRVTFLGPRTEARPYFGAADAFVLPTLYDPSPTPRYARWPAGLPVVTSTKSGAADLVLDNDAGLVCPSGDVAALAAHLLTLQDTAARERLAVNARRAVLPLSPTAITLQLVILYRDLLATAVLGAKGPSTITRAGSTPSVSR